MIQVKWSAGHWLQVAAGNGQPSKGVAVRVGNSIVARTVSLPITCRGTGCASFNIAGVSGTQRNVLVQLIGER